MALVTNTQRALTERALNSIGRHYFSVTVCGDEVPIGKPAPDPIGGPRRCWGLRRECLAIEDSVTGTAAAEGAGCPVLVVPNDVEVPQVRGAGTCQSLADLGVSPICDGYTAELSGATLGNVPPDYEA